MSGTLGHVRRERQKDEDDRIAAEIREVRQLQLEKNREEVIAEVCKLFGWSKLDDFAQKMVDNAINGKIVDIDKLKSDISAWKQAQEEPQEDHDAAVSP